MEKSTNFGKLMYDEVLYLYNNAVFEIFHVFFNSILQFQIEWTS